MKERPRNLRLRNWLNITFMVLAVATILIFFFYNEPNRRVVIFAVGSAAVIVKMAEVMSRITYKK